MRLGTGPGAMGTNRHAVAAADAHRLTFRQNLGAASFSFEPNDPHGTIGRTETILLAFLLIDVQ
jgi:hypothetical protein